MKKAFKKAISFLLVAVMIFGTAPLAGFVGFDIPEFNLFSTKAEATTDGYYYTVSDGEATITGRSPSISGDIVIPSTIGGYPVTGIGGVAFRFCADVESVVIPDGVTSIAQWAFESCSNLKNITIPDSVTNIGQYAFAFCSSLKSIAIPDRVTSIDGQGMFMECTSLESVTIGKGVTSIGFGTFLYCPALKSITVDSDNTALLSDENGILFNKNKTELLQYPAGKPEKNYVIPDSVRTIGKAAFNYSSNLESVTISNRVTSIGQAAFTGCINLKSITIPKSLTVIGSSVFPGCDNIRDIYYEGSKADWKNVGIGSNNGTLLTAKVHYNYRYSGGSTEIPDNTPAYDSSVVDAFLVATPSETIISYGDSIVLHVDPAKIPEGGNVKWYASNGNFEYSVSSFGTTCTITPKKSGDTTFTAIVYDADGNIVSADNQEMTSKAGFFDKFVAFFRKLFGLTQTIPEAIKSI